MAASASDSQGVPPLAGAKHRYPGVRSFEERDQTLPVRRDVGEIDGRRTAVEKALPLWAGAGYDERRGGFQERLNPDGSPDLTAPRRLRVQVRQIYVYAHAAVLGRLVVQPHDGVEDRLAVRGLELRAVAAREDEIDQAVHFFRVGLLEVQIGLA
jgi:hypothetical protein